MSDTIVNILWVAFALCLLLTFVAVAMARCKQKEEETPGLDRVLFRRRRRQP